MLVRAKLEQDALCPAACSSQCFCQPEVAAQSERTLVPSKSNSFSARVLVCCRARSQRIQKSIKFHARTALASVVAGNKTAFFRDGDFSSSVHDPDIEVISSRTRHPTPCDTDLSQTTRRATQTRSHAGQRSRKSQRHMNSVQQQVQSRHWKDC